MPIDWASVLAAQALEEEEERKKANPEAATQNAEPETHSRASGPRWTRERAPRHARSRAASSDGSSVLGDRDDGVWALGLEGPLKNLVLWRHPKVSGTLLCIVLLIYVVNNSHTANVSALLQLAALVTVGWYLFAVFARSLQKDDKWFWDFPDELPPEFEDALKPVFAFLLHKDTGFLHRLARACGGSTYDLVVVSISMGVTSRLLYSVPLPTLLLIACVALLTVFKIYEMRQRDIRAMRKQAERVLNDFYDKLDDDLFWFKIKRRKKKDPPAKAPAAAQ